MAVAAHQPQLEPAQRLAIVAKDRAELDVEVEVGLFALGLCRLGAGKRRLDEIGPVENVAAHRHPQHAVAGAVGFERHLVATRQAEHREICRHDVVGTVEFDAALHIDAGTGNGEIVETH